MSARRKLNRAFFTGPGAPGLAALVGLVTRSWWVFVLVLIVLLAGNLYSGDIRPPKPKR